MITRWFGTGRQDPMPGWDPAVTNGCATKSVAEGWYCTRLRDHEPPHVAHAGPDGVIVAIGYDVPE